MKKRKKNWMIGIFLFTLVKGNYWNMVDFINIFIDKRFNAKMSLGDLLKKLEIDLIAKQI